MSDAASSLPAAIADEERLEERLFAIREAGLLEPVLRLGRQTSEECVKDGRNLVRVAGVYGPTPQGQADEIDRVLRAYPIWRTTNS